MKNFLGLLIAGLISSQASATALPAIPSNCFSNNSYCLESSVSTWNDGIKWVTTNIFVELSASEYSLDDIKNLYFDFGSWPTYTSGSSSIRFSESEVKVATDAGIETRTHYAHYFLKSLLNDAEIREIANYNQIQNYDNALMSFQYKVDLQKTFSFPVAGQVKSSNLLGKEGYLHITLNADKTKYILYFENHVAPNIAFAHKLAVRYIEAGMRDVIKGMFSL